MKFLLDVHMPAELAESLEMEGHKCRMLAKIADPRSLDEEIIEIARQNNEVVLTHDLDFGTLLAFSNADSPSVVIFRISHINAHLFSNLIVNNWTAIQSPLENGAIVVFQESAIRIRALPIGKK